MKDIFILSFVLIIKKDAMNSILNKSKQYEQQKVVFSMLITM